MELLTTNDGYVIIQFVFREPLVLLAGPTFSWALGGPKTSNSFSVWEILLEDKLRVTSRFDIQSHPRATVKR
ncbi:unnamed protein product [Strongylus vulgaris]|uniref:Uncharacterized protein n=1 Tax=Strongylus vulgaris TaxID=40348 RepID=A0A3P7J6M4_STRVU|nr:unnamed protein product [Strongylus vulgaris]